MKDARMASVKKNAVFNFLLSFSNILFPLVTMPYISRILYINDIGLLNKGNALYALFVNLASFGLAGYGAREIARNKSDKNKICELFSSVLSCHLLTVFVFLIGYLAYIFIRIPATEERLINVLYALLFAIMPLSIEWFYTGMEDFRYIALRSLVVKTLLLILVFAFIHSKDDFLLYAIFFISAQGINFLYNIFHVHRYVNFSFKKIKLGATFLCAKFFYLQTVVAICYQNINQLILGKNEVQLALFVRAASFTTLVSALISPITTAVKPRIESIFATDKESYKSYIDNTFDCVLCVLCPVIFGMASLSHNIMYIFGGKQFETGTYVLAVSLAAAFSTQMASFLNNIISTPAGFEKNTFLSNLVVAVVALIFNPLLVFKYGALGAAVVLLMAETSGVCFHLILAKRKNLYFGWLKIKKIKYVLGSVVMFVIVLLIKHFVQNLYIQCLLAVPVGAAAYIGTVFLFTKITKDDVPFVLLVLKRKLGRNK